MKDMRIILVRGDRVWLERQVGRLVASVACLALCALAAPVSAQDDTYHISEAEKAACTSDAQRFCADAYPDEGKLLTCMTANQRSLGANCAAVFKAGKKQRGLR